MANVPSAMPEVMASVKTGLETIPPRLKPCVVAVFKYKLSRNLMPKVEFRYQQFDNKDFQTSPMTQYQGCMSPAPSSTPVPGCPIQTIDSTTSPTPVLSPNGAIPFYPYFQVGDTSAARYLFLGVDQPSYRAYYVSATLEIHF